MPGPRPPTPPVSRWRHAAEGFLLGISAFALLSIAAPLIEAPLAQSLCRLPPGQHFPSFACYLVEALAFVLWLGPTALIWQALFPSAATLVTIRLTSALFLGLLSGLLLAAYGRRRGSQALALASLVLIVISTLIAVLLVTSG